MPLLPILEQAIFSRMRSPFGSEHIRESLKNSS